MSGQLFDRYGAIVQEDVTVLEACLDLIAKAVHDRAGHGGRASVLEIGMHDGGTARGIENHLKENGVLLDYIGIDIDPGTTRPRYVPQDGIVIIGDSAEVFTQVPLGMDLVWVDGCHCFNHAVLDALHYSKCVREGGFICFHDINPAGQGASEHYQRHGPNIPSFSLCVVEALKAISFGEGFEPFMQLFPTDRTDCGTIAYRRV